MRRHRTGQPLRLLVVACLALLASACGANLTSVRDFAATSFDAAQYSQLVVTYVETPTRLKRYEPQAQWPELDRQASERKAQREQPLLRHKLVQEYMSALGQLAVASAPGGSWRGGSENGCLWQREEGHGGGSPCRALLWFPTPPKLLIMLGFLWGIRRRGSRPQYSGRRKRHGNAVLVSRASVARLRHGIRGDRSDL